jgi:hypothetical protein
MEENVRGKLHSSGPRKVEEEKPQQVQKTRQCRIEAERRWAGREVIVVEDGEGGGLAIKRTPYATAK